MIIESNITSDWMCSSCLVRTMMRFFSIFIAKCASSAMCRTSRTRPNVPVPGLSSDQCVGGRGAHGRTTGDDASREPCGATSACHAEHPSSVACVVERAACAEVSR